MMNEFNIQIDKRQQHLENSQKSKKDIKAFFGTFWVKGGRGELCMPIYIYDIGPIFE